MVEGQNIFLYGRMYFWQWFKVWVIDSSGTSPIAFYVYLSTDRRVSDDSNLRFDQHKRQPHWRCIQHLHRCITFSTSSFKRKVTQIQMLPSITVIQFYAWQMRRISIKHQAVLLSNGCPKVMLSVLDVLQGCAILTLEKKGVQQV